MFSPVSIAGRGEFAARFEASILDLNPSVEHGDVHRFPADAVRNVRKASGIETAQERHHSG